MLLRFAVSNHRSIFNRQELSMLAAPLKGAEDGLLKTTAASQQVVPVAVVYGANASGKSNVISSLFFARKVILLSHKDGDPEGGVPISPFRLAGELADKTTFDIDFALGGVRYHYGFTADKDEFMEEWLYTFPQGRKKLLFERAGPKEIRFGRDLKGRNKIISDIMRRNSLFLSAAMQNGHEQLIEIGSFFKSMLFTNLIEVKGGLISQNFRKREVDDRTLDFLKKIGTGVTGYRRISKKLEENDIAMRRGFFEALNKINANAETMPEIATDEVMIELAHKGVNGKEVYFKPEIESAGTRRLLMLISLAYSALDTGSVIVIDELDASMHTQACEAIIALFSDKKCNTRGAQVVATTHDTNLMLSSMLRRDQIWFTEKDEFGATHLYPLSDIRTRESDNIERGYLQGRFGAIPFAGLASRLFSGCE